MKTYRRWLAVCIAIVAALLTGFVCLYLLVVLGVVTGVIAMCSSAAPWWAWTWLALVSIAVIAFACCAALLALRWYRSACRSTLPVR